MKEKKIWFIIGLIIVVILILSIFTVKNTKVTNDEKRFKKEYERFNGRTGLSTGKKYKKVNISDKNGVKYVSGKKVVELLSKGTGVIYFGFPECPWCRNMIEPFLEVMNEKEETVYYFNAYSIRDEKDLDENNEVFTRQEGTKTYYEILDLLGDKASVYDGLNDESIKRLYFPTIVFVKKGKIVDIHTSTVSSQKDPYKSLSQKQLKELKTIYEDGLKKMKKSNSNICTDKGSC